MKKVEQVKRVRAKECRQHFDQWAHSKEGSLPFNFRAIESSSRLASSQIRRQKNEKYVGNARSV